MHCYKECAASWILRNRGHRHGRFGGVKKTSPLPGMQYPFRRIFLDKRRGDIYTQFSVCLQSDKTDFRFLSRNPGFRRNPEQQGEAENVQDGAPVLSGRGKFSPARAKRPFRPDHLYPEHV